MVTLTLEEMEVLSPEQRVAHQAEEAKIVFGHDHRVIKGRPVEQGIGAPGRETENHYASIRKYEGPEAEKKARAKAAKRRNAS
ncbi:hypothetical protein JIR23_21215 [Bradyrhizobium diazoefficiens]|nr:hypothetical protein [Bradyrhizobium diazoefficiens]QQN62121.1 hypothetical protein JIR23_21215 [Bradyrhizobium diazoefficiens]